MGIQLLMDHVRAGYIAPPEVYDEMDALIHLWAVPQRTSIGFWSSIRMFQLVFVAARCSSNWR